MKKILLTGSNGYIGYNFYNKYKDKFRFKFCDYGTISPLAHMLSENDIKDCSYIVHLAALSGIIACEENPIEAVRDNVLTAQNVFKLGYKLKIPVIMASSQAVKTPTSSKYAFMKWTCEKIAEYYNIIGGKNYILRLSNVFGGDFYIEKKNTVVKQFITKYREGKELEVDGDGKQTRDIIHVYDVCEAILKILEIQPEEKSPMDIGTGMEISILDLANMFPNAKIKFNKSRSAGVGSSVADISVAKKRIGFKAKRKLEDYIKEMI